MPAKNPRLQVTFEPSELEIIHILSSQKHVSASSFVKKIVSDWLEDYEELMLAKRAEEAEKRAEGKPMISHEDLWKKLDL